MFVITNYIYNFLKKKYQLLFKYILPQQKRVILGDVRFYGTSNEFDIISNKSYVNYVNENTGANIDLKIFKKKVLSSWHDSIQITKFLNDNNFKIDLPKKFESVLSLNAIGAGIQNTCDLENFISLVKQKFNKEKISIYTLFIVPESEEIYQESLKNKIDNNIKKLNFDDAPKRKLKIRNVIKNGQITLIDSYGRRETSTNNFKNKIHFFGGSEIFGSYLDNQDTIASNFAKIFQNKNYNIYNHGVGGVNFIEIINKIFRNSYSPGDIIILAVPYHIKLALADIKISCSKNEMFDYTHVNKLGSKKVAQGINDHILENLENKTTKIFIPSKKALTALKYYQNFIKRTEAAEFNNQELQKNLNYFKSKKIKNDNENKYSYGSVAVNCNPITKGHEYLIDFARSKVDYLYVIVLENQSTSISFSDRYELVKLVCKKKNNVIVVKGGNYVCSEFISPEYYFKENNQDLIVDFSLESFYFGNYIAPTLGITQIFLGEEPKCKITKQYNEHMKETMPHYGINLTIIERTNLSNGEIISASSVRKLIKENKWSEALNFVPSETHAYLKNVKFLN